MDASTRLTRRALPVGTLGQSAAAIAAACSTLAFATQASRLGASADIDTKDPSAFAVTLTIALILIPLALACCAGQAWARKGMLLAVPAAAVASLVVGIEGAPLVGGAVLVMLIADAIRCRTD